MKRILALFVSIVLIVFCSKVSGDDSYREIDVKNGGTISGTVTLKGSPPAPEVIPVSKDTAACGKSKTLQSVITGANGGLKNVIVGLEGIKEGKRMLHNVKVEMTQLNCEYSPHILIMPKDGTLEMVNDDSLLHNVHAYDLSETGDGQTGPSTMFNIAMPFKGLKIAKPMNNACLVRLLCDAGHPWMNAYVLVTENPYFTVTDENGNFTLDQVPPGTYTIRIWHEGLAKVEAATKSFKASEPCKSTRKVTVSPGATTNVHFTVIVNQPNTRNARLSVE
jgi:hypothetical protein